MRKLSFFLVLLIIVVISLEDRRDDEYFFQGLWELNDTKTIPKMDEAQITGAIPISQISLRPNSEGNLEIIAAKWKGIYRSNLAPNRVMKTLIPAKATFREIEMKPPNEDAKNVSLIVFDYKCLYGVESFSFLFTVFNDQVIANFAYELYRKV